MNLQVQNKVEVKVNNNKMTSHQISSAEEDVDDEEDIEEEYLREPDEYEMFLNEEVSDCFSIFDKTDSGYFEARFLKKALQCLGIQLNSLEMEEFKAEVVLDGVVYYEQFRSVVVQQMMDMEDIEHVRNALRNFDPENEGFIHAERFKRYMTKFGNPLTEKEVKEIIKLGDPGSKGTVSYENLTLVLLTKK